MLKRYRDQGTPGDDLPLVQWACDDALFAVQRGLDDLLKNYPNPAVAFMLRALVFPLGRRLRPPGDALGHQVAQLLLHPGPARERLTRGVFVPDRTAPGLGLLEDAIHKTVAAEPAESKLHEAVRQGLLTPMDDEALIELGVAHNVITGGEAELLRAAVEARRAAIQVDDFPPDYWHKPRPPWHNNSAHEPAGAETSI